MLEHTPHTDRRILKRTDCRALVTSHSSVLISGRRTYCVSLVDMHIQGARLRFMDLSSSTAVDPGDTCRFSIHVARKGLKSGPVPCRITWKRGAEVGVNFQNEPGKPMPDMQRFLDF